MRPLRLEIEGFTSFKEPLGLDFDGLDLFAITGPTGAGKSSLIDAMVFALYGQVPRVGREYKQLISHGAERLSVKLDFEVAGRKYRVARTARLAGNPQTVLEQQTAKGFEPLAGRVKEIEEAILKIVGLDYDAFTRSVVLPQGQFDAFLKGEPKERHKILIALLNLDVYVEMQKIANRRASDAKREADFIGSQLATDYKDATPEVLAARQAELAEAQNAQARTHAAIEAVSRGLASAREVAAARREVSQAIRDAEAQTRIAQEAETTLGEAGARRKTLAAEVKLAEQKFAAVQFDAPRHQALLLARPRAEQLLELEPQRERLARARREHAAALDQAVTRAGKAEAAQPELDRRHAEAAAALAAARSEREALHRRHAAMELRRKLAPGDPCPVCEQTIAAIPKGVAPDLDRAEATLKKAERHETEARKALDDGRLLAERARGEKQRVAEQGDQLAGQEKELERQLRSVSEALEAAGFKPLERADPKALLAALSSELKSLEKARAERERLEAERRKLEAAAGQLEVAVAAAGAQLEAARKRVAEIAARQEQARAGLERGEQMLRALAQASGWDLGSDEAAALDRLQRTLQGQHA
ncbi:MAG TPA: SMC family ATPase, partial [Vicinamibacteria bacterium]